MIVHEKKVAANKQNHNVHMETRSSNLTMHEKTKIGREKLQSSKQNYL